MSASPAHPSSAVTSGEIPSQIDVVISVHLHLWPALSIAIQNGWGTANPQLGEDKRAWLAGAVSDLFAQNQLRDLEDLEDVLEQVMSDEFEVVVDDGTLEETASKIWKSVDRVRKGDGSEATSLMAEWENHRQKGTKIPGIVRGGANHAGGEDHDDSSEEDDDDEEGDWNGFQDLPTPRHALTDTDMDEAPPLVESSTKQPAPELDEDGFTRVVGKKRK